MREILEKHVAASTYAASGVTILAGLSLSDWGVLIGIVIAIATFGMNWYYKHQAFNLMRQKRSTDCPDVCPKE